MTVSPVRSKSVRANDFLHFHLFRQDALIDAER
jgi:hypothetical protein